MKYDDKPQEHIDLAKRAAQAGIDAATNGSRIQAENLTIELIEANRHYMSEQESKRADQTIKALRSGKVRYDGSQFDSILEPKFRH